MNSVGYSDMNIIPSVASDISLMKFNCSTNVVIS